MLAGAGFGTGDTNDIAYVTLSDTLIQVGKEDVQEIIIIPSPPESDTQNEMPNKITEDGQGEEKSKANTFWLGVVIFHCLLAILWLARKKRKRETKN